MADFNEHKKEIERMLVETIIKALEQKQLTNEELPNVSAFILKEIGNTKTHEDLTKSLQELFKRWILFKDIIVLENEEVASTTKEQTVQKVVELTKENKIEEALGAAKAATNNP